MQYLTFIASLAFCSLFLCLCYGAPVEEGSTSRRNSRKYSSVEESFIIDEMMRYPVDILPIWGQEMWALIAKNHCKMRESNPSIFPPRTDLGIKLHFNTILRHSKGKVELPIDLIRRLPTLQKNQQDDQGSSYTSENEHESGTQRAGSSTTRYNSRQYSHAEESFIIDQLRRYPGESLPIWGQGIWTEIAKNHCKMRESDPSIFPPRTDVAIRMHFQKIMLNSKGKVALPNDLIRRLPTPQKSKRADDPGPGYPSENEHQSVISGAAVREGVHLHDTQKTRNKYTSEEDRFIINFLKRYPRERRHLFSKKMWIEAAEQFRELRKTNPTEFPYERSSSALQLHFRRMAKLLLSKGAKQIPDPDNAKMRYTKAESDFIIEELLKTTSTSLYSVLTWQKIKALHDNKVVSKAPGFQHYRSASGLKNHFIQLRQMNQVPPALKSKFPPKHSRTQGETSNTREASKEDSTIWDLLEQDFAELQDNFELEEEEEEEGEEESGQWDTMIDELLNTPFDVEFDSLQAINPGNDVPHEVLQHRSKRGKNVRQ